LIGQTVEHGAEGVVNTAVFGFGLGVGSTIPYRREFERCWAIGQELKYAKELLQQLKTGLNTYSRFEFGKLITRQAR
jgi:hypothetical protein